MSWEGTDGAMKTVTLSFGRAELLYDAASEAYVAGDVMDEGSEARHQLMDVATGNADLATRALDAAHAACTEMLYPLTREDADGGAALDDALRETAAYRIRLSLPAGFSMTTVRLLETLVHEYMVCRTLASLAALAAPAAAGAWTARMAGAEEELRRAAARAGGRRRRRLKPW